MISVIVPMYNAQSWIGRCLETVTSQSYKDMEIIVVDDGSRDKSISIAEEYAKKDERVIIVSQKNHGVGYSRNIGISKSNGEYLAFIDSDDYVLPDYFEKMIGFMTDEVDLVICGYNEVCIDHGRIRTVNTHVLKYHIYSKLTGNIYEDFYNIREFVNSPWLKIYRKSLIDEYGIRFPEDMITGEDLIFNLTFYQHIKKYVYVPFAGYQYFNNDLSVTHNASMEHFFSLLKTKKREVKLLAGHHIPNLKKYIGEIIYGNLQWFIHIDEHDSLFRYLKMMGQLEKKRTFVVLDSKKATVILLLYKTHLLWIYYFLARQRRKKTYVWCRLEEKV